MNSYLAIVHIMPHKVLLDPAGKTTLQALHQLGFNTVSDTRIGKRIEITLQAENPQSAQQIAQQIAQQLLVNPIIEYFNIEIQNL